jgi:hypothetical protein
MTKKEMIKKIREVIADKTLSFGCKIILRGTYSAFIAKKRFGDDDL